MPNPDLNSPSREPLAHPAEGAPAGRKPRVLLIAEEANPEWVSVPLVGWSTSKALVSVTDAHIVTQTRNASAFERADLDKRRYTILDNEWLAAPMHRLAEMLRGGAGKGWTTLTAVKALVYWSFEREVWKKFGDSISNGTFDIVHRITPLTPTIPSPIARKCARAGVPFVIGPLNGGIPWPKDFRHAQHKEREWLSHVRSAYKLLPGYRSTLRAASAIICASRHTLSEVPSKLHEKCFYLPENGVDAASIVDAPQPWENGQPLRLVFVGRLVPYKGADMAIEAAAPHLLAGSCTLDIIGDGPEGPTLRDLAVKLGVTSQVRFHGWLPHDQVMATLSRCHAMIFPSIREFGGGVVLEALARGVFPIVVNYGGPGELVATDSASVVDLGNRESIVAGYRQALSTAIGDPGTLDSARRRGLLRAKTLFTWQAKAVQISRVYAWIMGGNRPHSNLLAALPHLDAGAR
jgi:glycosyltransferase involved in cell wall biosynthesis